MQDFLSRISHFSPKRLALLAAELQHRIDDLQQARHEPIAIVGIGCRFPGNADTAEQYWELLREGGNAIREVPADRWSLERYYDPDPDAPGKMSTRWGGFISCIDSFDPQFFGISPREAQSMDPQQRLLLEVAWEALEHAGLSPDRVNDSRTGVFIGISASDYYQLLRSCGLQSFDAYTASGSAHSIASGRLSYVLGARGPSISLDTACSSSLLALHQAVHSLRRGECQLALAGGVNLILAPDITIALSKAHMMAPDGQCKAFDARADGFVRGEGCGVLVLKRWSDARADGDRVIALIRGSAANQDGRSNGLTAPNGQAQEAVLRDALADARIAPQRVSYVEAHGTGTALGDPIEVQALAAVLGERPQHEPLLIGSVKANIGHLEAAAGIAGVIKVALALQHREIPRQLHLEQPNPHIPWHELAVRVPTCATPWPAQLEQPRIAGVSSFGFSGTNVHVILEEAPRAAVEEGAQDSSVIERPLHVLTLSARQPEALRELAVRYRDSLRSMQVSIADFAHTANVGRMHFSHRLAVQASSAQEAALRLDEYLGAGCAEGVLAGQARSRAPRIAFLFTGQGSQYAGMAQDLFATHPQFRATLERCDELLRAHLPRSLLSVIFPSSDAPTELASVDTTEYTQPVLFALEYALASLWMSWGVRPSAVLGHSVGEYAAACIAGVMSLEDALALVTERGRLMGALPRNGAMAAVIADEALVSAALAPWRGQVGIAAVNGPENIVISGLDSAVAAVIAQLADKGIDAMPLNVSHAFHSPLVKPILEAFGAAVDRVKLSAPRIDLVSNVSGLLADSAITTSTYWREHVVVPVQFAKGMQTLAQLGCDVFLEIGPQPTLVSMGKLCLPGSQGVWLASMRRGKPDWPQMLDSLSRLYTCGVAVDWRGFDAPYTRQRAILPHYPFQRARYWVDPPSDADPDEHGAQASGTVRAEPGLLYRIAWRERALASSGVGAGGAPSAQSIAGRLSALVADIAATCGIEEYAHFFPRLDALVTQYIVDALVALGWKAEVGASFPTADLAARLGVLPRHARLFSRMLQILAEDGILAAQGVYWRINGPLPSGDTEAEYAALLARHPDCEAELALTRRCARELARVLRGEIDPLTLLFPGGSAADTERLYQRSPPARAYNTLIARVFAQLHAQMEASLSARPLRVLEIGAGTGSTTSYVLPVLPEQVEYTFTDISPLFLKNAREKFRHRSNMHYRVLDIGRDPLGQGYEAESFDVVLGANVLHATADLEVTLGHVRRLMAPGALLVLLEGTSPQRFGDVTVGMLEGWWAYTDTERRRYALMSRDRWIELLLQQDFIEPTAVPGESAGPVLSQQAVFLARAPLAAAARAARWLIVPDRRGMAEALATSLQSAGESVTVLPHTANGSEAQLYDACAQQGALDGVVHLGALDLELNEDTRVAELAQDQEWLVRSTLQIVQGLASRSGHSPALLLVTRGGQALDGHETANPAQATLWGMSHVIAIEHPELRCRRLDLDPSWGLERSAATIVAELRETSREDQIAWRGERRRVRRLVPRSTAAAERLPPMRIHADRSYLVTGGLRGLGLRVAQWLVEQGARHLALMGRREPDATANEMMLRLHERGATVMPVCGDVAVRADVERVLAQVSRAMPPLSGIVHAAGVLDDGVLLAQDWPRFATVMAPKVLGSWHLHQLAGTLDFFVLFSSGASLAGSAGQANHAAANAFEDALAWYRQARGQPTVSINWGPWAQIGAAAERHIETTGLLQAISPEEGLNALDLVLRRAPEERVFPIAQTAVLAADWHYLLETKEALPLFDELLEQARRHPRAGTSVTTRTREPEPSLLERLQAAAPNRRRSVLRDYVRGLTVRVLGLASPEELDVNEPLRQVGLDSLMAVELRNLLGQAVGRTLPASLTFDHPSVSALVEHLAADVLVEVMGPDRRGEEGADSGQKATVSDEPGAEMGESSRRAAEFARTADGITADYDELGEDDLAAALAGRLARIDTRETQ